MKLSVIEKFLSACKSAEISEYRLSTDVGTHYYNNDSSVILLDKVEEAVLAIKQATVSPDQIGNDKLQVQIADLVDIHEATIFGSYDKIKNFASNYGLELSDEQIKILLKIDGSNYNLKPITGDYVNEFVELTEDELDNLSEEERADYEARLEEHKKVKLSNRMAAQISI